MATLGTIELSSDILTKSQIGLWAFELDPDCPPRMYVNDTMLHLIGLTKQISPEKTYHAWYDHVDSAHYAEVNASVEKMISGIHAEVQYPWHHPDGRVMTVRCGGIRNFLYTKGVRIEGTHMNVSDVVHLEKRNLADLLAKLADNFLFVYFLDPYTGSFEVHALDPVNGSKVPANTSKLNFYRHFASQDKRNFFSEDLQTLNKTFTQPHLIQVLENNSTEEFVIRHKNPVNSSIRYMKCKIINYTEADGTKKLIIGVTDVTKEKLSELQLEEKLQAVEALTQDYDYVDIVDLFEDKQKDTSTHFRIPNREDKYVPGWNEDIPYAQKLGFLRDYMVYEPDRESFDKQTLRETVLDRLKRHSVYYVNFRIVTYGIIHYGQIKFTAIKDSTGKIVRLFVAYINADKQMMVLKDLHDKLDSVSKELEKAEQEKARLFSEISSNIRDPMKDVVGLNRTALNRIDDREKVRDCLVKINLSSRRMVGVLNELLPDPDANSNERAENDCSVLKGKRVLLVEDNELNREIACDILEEYGIIVEQAENGQIAVEKCKEVFRSNPENAPDVILMDCQMPVMNGYDASKEICIMMTEKDLRIPIIAMTANAFEEDRKKSYEYGMSAHISKPIDRKELERILISFTK